MLSIILINIDHNIINIITFQIHQNSKRSYSLFLYQICLLSQADVTMLGGSKVIVTAVRNKHRACAQIAEMIRVDHAGEFGADRIYAGQMAVLAGSTSGPKIKEMWEQEKEHRAKFEELLYQRRVRPTFLLPIWHVGGFMLGAGSALLGECDVE